jgi:hypothetical protein
VIYFSNLVAQLCSTHLYQQTSWMHFRQSIGLPETHGVQDGERMATSEWNVLADGKGVAAFVKLREVHPLLWVACLPKMLNYRWIREICITVDTVETTSRALILLFEENLLRLEVLFIGFEPDWDSLKRVSWCLRLMAGRFSLCRILSVEDFYLIVLQWQSLVRKNPRQMKLYHCPKYSVSCLCCVS